MSRAHAARARALLLRLLRRTDYAANTGTPTAWWVAASEAATALENLLYALPTRPALRLPQGRVNLG